MVGKEDDPPNAQASCQTLGSRRMFWRSASWSASRSMPHNSDEGERCYMDPDGSVGNSVGQNRRFLPAPLTPRSHHNSKARSCLPPLQPLSIARRSLDEWPKAGSDDIGEWPHPITPGGGERLKLDLSSIQRNPDRNVGLVKREKIAFFDKECSKVAEHIYLGGNAVARDRDVLKQNGITHVLNCVGFVCPEYFKADFVYRTLWLQDSPSEDITSILYDVFDYFEDVRQQDGRVFVHCCQGVSRSTSLVIAYLMWREGQSFDDAFQYVKAARGIADPNMGFACQLLQCQKRVHAFPLSPSSLLRMYRMAPHSPYDPLHLVPKMLNDPSMCALDSRGAFIVHIPSAIYVWIGKNCGAIMERDVRGAVAQIVRYEKVQGPIVMIKEGEEPPYFWDAFSSLLPLMPKSSSTVEIKKLNTKFFPGERKVDSYDVDFDVFQKAIMGGIVPPFASSEDEHETHLPARESSWSLLRRKFASADMKEFVLAPKLSLSRVYSDSMMIVHSNANSSSSLSLSSSSSPVYLSPDSVSSGASTKYFSESSIDSPSAALSSLSVSLPLTNFSDLSLHSSKCSSDSLSTNSEIQCDKLTSQPCPQSITSQARKSSPSLAERRGSLSKSLKLPLMTDKIGVTKSPTSFLVSQEDFVKERREINYLCDSGTSMKDLSKPKDSVESGKVEIFSGAIASWDSFNKEDNAIKKQIEPWRSNCSREGPGSTALTKIDESCSLEFNLVQTLVCRWPSLEKIPKFGANSLDSQAAFVIFSPHTKLGYNKGSVLYFWVGSSFNRGISNVQLDSDKELGFVGATDWSQIGRNILAQMDLPKDTSIKIVYESEEPEEFYALLDAL